MKCPKRYLMVQSGLQVKQRFTAQSSDLVKYERMYGQHNIDSQTMNINGDLHNSNPMQVAGDLNKYKNCKFVNEVILFCLPVSSIFG
jgi:hypothetical protein